MSLISKRPLTPSQRFRTQNRTEVSSKRPERLLVESKTSTGGRNVYGRLTSRRRGGGHKKLYRLIDFKREKLGIPATVRAIEYDPNRTANLALLVYADGEKRYILAPNALAVGDTVSSTAEAVEFKAGNAMPLRVIPPSSKIHAIELYPRRGAQLVRSAGAGAQLIGVEGDKATIRLPSGELRRVHADCRATLGEVGNAEHQNATLGKAGRNRWKGRRPRVRGMVMNPVDHPNGGGNGKSKGGGGKQHPVSPWGQLAKGFPTRKRSKASSSLILVRRNGRAPRGRK